MYSGGHKARPYKITTKHTTTSGGQYRLSSQRSIAQTTYAVVICFIHFATTPSTNLSIPLSLRLFPLPLHPLEEEGGPIKRHARELDILVVKSPPSDGLCPPAPPAIQLRWQGERCISNGTSRYKLNNRIYRLVVPSSRKA